MLANKVLISKKFLINCCHSYSQAHLSCQERHSWEGGCAPSSLPLTSSISLVLYRTHRLQVCLRGQNYTLHLRQLCTSLLCQPRRCEHRARGGCTAAGGVPERLILLCCWLPAEHRRARDSSAQLGFISSQGHIHRCQLQAQITTIYMSVPLSSLLVIALERTTKFFASSRGTWEGMCPWQGTCEYFRLEREAAGLDSLWQHTEDFQDQEHVKGETMRSLHITPCLGSNGVWTAGVLS